MRTGRRRRRSCLGQILPSDAFLQAQIGAEAPLYEGAENEAFGRIVLDRTFTSDRWGRSWSPMEVESQAKRDLEVGAPVALDFVPQIQVSLNTRQHVLANVGVSIPATETSGRPPRLLAYLLLDWFDGGFSKGGDDRVRALCGNVDGDRNDAGGSRLGRGAPGRAPFVRGRLRGCGARGGRGLPDIGSLPRLPQGRDHLGWSGSDTIGGRP